MKLKCLLLLSVFSAFNFSSLAQFPFLTDSLDGFIAREMDRWKIPGMAVAIVKDGNVEWLKGYGVREQGKPGTVDEATLFQVASNTKLFTATCLAMLGVEKRLKLDDKILQWLPGFSLYDSLALRDVTVRDMLCHRIGYQTFQSDLLNWNSNMTREGLIYNMRNVKPVYGFRSKWGYCNMGYVVAGQVLKAATDTLWEDFVRTRIFMPLEMRRTHTSFIALQNDTNAATAHTVIMDSLRTIPYANMENIGPCASINTSIADLTHWMLMELDTGRYESAVVVPAAAIKETWRSQMVMGEANNPLFPQMHFANYGLGLELNDFAGRKIMSHSGGANGFVTQIMLVPEENLGIAVLTNTDANQLYSSLCFQILEAYLGLPYRNLSEIAYDGFEEHTFAMESEINAWEDRVALKPKAALPLDRYAGKYNNPVYGEIEIRKEDGKLNIYFSHHPGNVGHLEPYGGNDFVCRYSDVTYGVKMISFTEENEKVKTVTIRVNDFVDFMPYEFVKAY